VLQFLWLLQEAPVTPCETDDREFVFIGHNDDVTGDAPSYYFLFERQHAKYQLLTNAAQVQHIIKILHKFQPLMQFGPQISICHFSQSLAHSRHLSHLLSLMDATTRVIVKNLASNMEAFMPVINLRHFSLLCHRTLSTTRLMSPLVISAARHKI
jgi:hypothetical protein